MKLGALFSSHGEANKRKEESGRKKEVVLEESGRLREGKRGLRGDGGEREVGESDQGEGGKRKRGKGEVGRDEEREKNELR